MPTDDPALPPQPPQPAAGGIGAWGDRARGFLGGAGGGMAANLVSSFFNRRRAGGGGGGGGLPVDPSAPGGVIDDSGRGGYVPPKPREVEEGEQMLRPKILG